MSIDPIQALAAIGGQAPIDAAGATTAAVSGRAPSSFAQMMLDGVDQTNQKLLDADRLATAFALDDSIPLHQVTYALSRAQGSFQLLMQVRSRLVEGYQELMRMQL